MHNVARLKNRRVHFTSRSIPFAWNLWGFLFVRCYQNSCYRGFDQRCNYIVVKSQDYVVSRSHAFALPKNCVEFASKSNGSCNRSLMLRLQLRPSVTEVALNVADALQSRFSCNHRIGSTPFSTLLTPRTLYAHLPTISQRIKPTASPLMWREHTIPLSVSGKTTEIMYMIIYIFGCEWKLDFRK